jgi:predicted type IV restriction endonuclease
MDLGEIVTSERAETAIKALEIAEAENKRLIARVKELQFDCAERAKTNSELVERVKRLAIGEMTDDNYFAGIVKRYNS